MITHFFQLDEEEKRLRHIANYQIRQAKRAGRDKKIHVFDERNEGEKRRQKKKKKGKLAKNFIDELTSIERKDVKRFRYGSVDFFNFFILKSFKENSNISNIHSRL